MEFKFPKPQAPEFKKIEDIKEEVKKAVDGTDFSVVELPPKLDKFAGKPDEPEKMQILKEYGGLESNVPVNHPRYWKL